MKLTYLKRVLFVAWIVSGVVGIVGAIHLGHMAWAMVTFVPAVLILGWSTVRDRSAAQVCPGLIAPRSTASRSMRT